MHIQYSTDACGHVPSRREEMDYTGRTTSRPPAPTNHRHHDHHQQQHSTHPTNLSWRLSSRLAFTAGDRPTVTPRAAAARLDRPSFSAEPPGSRINFAHDKIGTRRMLDYVHDELDSLRAAVSFSGEVAAHSHENTRAVSAAAAATTAAAAALVLSEPTNRTGAQRGCSALGRNLNLRRCSSEHLGNETLENRRARWRRCKAVPMQLSLLASKLVRSDKTPTRHGPFKIQNK